MIIKSMSRKSMSFSQLLQYIDGPKEKGTPLLHNFGAASSEDEIRAELLRNGHLLPPRKNGNFLYHEILSFGEGDRERVIPAILEDVTRLYLEKRAPYALGYARAHFDTGNPHVHILLSANDLGSSKRLRLPKARLRQIQLELERYHRERYPELRHSIAQRPRQLPEKRAEQEMRRRGMTAPTQKERLKELLARELESAISGGDYYRRLLTQGVRLYRRGRSVGVEDSTGRKHRLKTLGLADDFDRRLSNWRQIPKNLKTLRSLELQTRPRARDGPDLEI